ncbi:hypothetical protein PoB_004085100 [Plakobranchus ocellatus]|uniref:Uncharacterized protein n=1 Tax=Plakobranchus ocellatus TaxID=259542 RepID=A0AAV4B1G8_9GAST|nr:hypothetical protein PoB_004085100 [Plakobranchus ocellatus]
MYLASGEKNPLYRSVARDWPMSLDMRGMWNHFLVQPNSRPSLKTFGGIDSTINGEPALRSARTLLPRVRAPHQCPDMMAGQEA